MLFLKIFVGLQISSKNWASRRVQTTFLGWVVVNLPWEGWKRGGEWRKLWSSGVFVEWFRRTQKKHNSKNGTNHKTYTTNKTFHEFSPSQSMFMIAKGVLVPTLIPQRNLFTGFTLQLSLTSSTTHIHHCPYSPYDTQIAKPPGQVYSIRVHLYFAFLCPLGLLLTTSFSKFGDKISGPSTCHIAGRVTGRMTGRPSVFPSVTQHPCLNTRVALIWLESNFSRFEMFKGTPTTWQWNNKTVILPAPTNHFKPQLLLGQ